MEKQGKRHSQIITPSQRQYKPKQDKGQPRGRIMGSLELEQCVSHQGEGGMGLLWSNKRIFGVQRREWQEHKKDGGWRKLENEGKIYIALPNNLQGKVTGWLFRGWEKHWRKGEGRVPGWRARESMAYLGNSEKPVWRRGSLKMDCGGNDWKDMLRSNYGRDNEWEWIGEYKEKVKDWAEVNGTSGGIA